MFNRRIILVTLIQIITFALLFSSCAGRGVYNSPSLSDIVLSVDVDKKLNPVDATTEFTTNPRAIFCSFTPNKFAPGTKITAVWVYVKGEVADLANYAIEQHSELVKKEGRMAMYIQRPPSGWPKGSYKVVLLVNDIEEANIPFTIK
jgi:hypothetical protein